MNPYKVLGIRPNASKDEIEEAYKNIIETNNLNANSDNPVEFLTEEHLSRVNEAFYSLSGEIKLKEIRDLIESEQFIAAETELNLIADKKNAEWNYLKGFVLLKKGWFNAGVSHLKTATELNPENEEYRETIRLLNKKMGEIRATYARMARNNSKNDMDICGGGGNNMDMCGGGNGGGAGMPNNMDMCSGGGTPPSMPNNMDMCNGGQGAPPNMMNNQGGGNPLGNMGANPFGNMGGGNNGGNPLQNMLLQGMMSPNNMNMCGNGGGGMC